MNISVLILTYNEEQCLRSCIDSVSWSDDIVVLDCFSSDATAAIAAEYAQVRLLQRRFDDFSTQRNHGLREIPYKHDFLFLIDADETCPPDLQREMLGTLQAGKNDISLYYIRRKLFYADVWLRHNSSYPVWLGRLIRPREVTYSGIIHEQLHTEGRCGFLSHHIHHYPFCKGLDNWIERRIAYSNLVNDPVASPDHYTRSGTGDAIAPVRRRRSMNRFYRKLPARWLAFLGYNVLVRLCFLDGRRGMEYVMLETWYELITYVKRNSARTRAEKQYCTRIA